MSASTKLDLSGLDSMAGLMRAGAESAAAVGKPLSIKLELIHENPSNRRTTFDQDALQELADSIAAKGVHSPISVRPHPDIKGRYVINHGHRRFRASQLAGKAEIPAFLDESHDDFDQLTENIQRENLSTREIVDAIAALLAEGNTPAEIGRRLGKSKTWVSKHKALSDLPEPLALLLASGRCRDASTLYEALQCYKSDPETVTEMLTRAEATDRQIVQADIEALRAAIKRKSQPVPPAPTEDAPSDGTPLAVIFADDEADPIPDSEPGPTPLADLYRAEKSRATEGRSAITVDQGADANRSDQGGDDGEGEGERKQNVRPSSKPAPDPTKVRKPNVQVRVGRREAVLLVGKAAAYGLVWVEYEDATTEEIDAGKVKLVAITEGAK